MSAASQKERRPAEGLSRAGTNVEQKVASRAPNPKTQLTPKPHTLASVDEASPKTTALVHIPKKFDCRSDRDQCLVDAFPTLLRAERLASGGLAVLAAHICEHDLYKLAGVTSRKEFAEAHGIEETTLSAWITAGRVALKFYEEDCRALLQALRATSIRIENLSSFPEYWKLLLLGRLTKCIDRNPALSTEQRDAEKRALVNDVRGEGRYSVAELKRLYSDARAKQATASEPQTSTQSVATNPYLDRLPDDIAGPLHATHRLGEALLIYTPGALDQAALDLIEARGHAILEAVRRLRLRRNESAAHASADGSVDDGDDADDAERPFAATTGTSSDNTAEAPVAIATIAL